MATHGINDGRGQLSTTDFLRLVPVESSIPGRNGIGELSRRNELRNALRDKFNWPAPREDLSCCDKRMTLTPDLWFCITLGGRPFDAYKSLIRRSRRKIVW